MLLKSITLQNFLSFGAEQTLELRPLNVLVGPNGTGKSNLIEAINLLRTRPEDVKLSMVGVWSKAEESSFVVGTELCFPKEFGGLRYLRRFATKEHKSPLFSAMEHIESVYSDFEKGLLTDDDRRTWLRIKLDRVYIYRGLEIDDAALAARLHTLLGILAVKKKILSALNVLDEAFEEIEVRKTFFKEGTHHIEIKDADYVLPQMRFSDGTRHWLHLLAILYDPVPPHLICIEHPEVGLHPDVLPKLAELLKKASERTQLIVTTHSETLLDALTDVPEAIVVVEKGEQGTTLTRLDADKMKPWLEKYRLGDLWMRGELGGVRW